MFDALPLSDAKAIAKRLSKHLATQGVPLKHSQALEAVAAMFGCRDFNTLHAALINQQPATEAHAADISHTSEFADGVIKFLQELFAENHIGRNGKNPQAAFLVAWREEQLDRLVERAQRTIERLGRRAILANAADKTPLSFYNDIAQAEFRSSDKAAQHIADMLYNNDVVLIITEISKLNDTGKDRHARWIAKVLDDAHFDRVHPKADVVFIDYASFLEKSYRSLGHYVRVLAETSPWEF